MCLNFYAKCKPTVWLILPVGGNGGQPVRVWDGCLAGTLLLPSGIASDGSGGLWVTNAGNGTLVHFQTQNP